MIIKSRPIHIALVTLAVLIFLLLFYILDLRPLLIILHDLAHSLSLLLALFLTGIAIVSYIRDGRKRYLLLSAAFITLTINEGLTFLSTSFTPLVEPVIPLIGDPVSHWLNLVVITLLFTSLLVKDEG